MPHVLILGMTGSGKTTLARLLCQQYRARGVKTGVLDPINDPRWNADFQTTKQDDFLRVVWASRSCAFFVDEGAETVGRYNDVMRETATRGRHWGHNLHYICQRGNLLALTVRDQCDDLFLFVSGRKDCILHAEEWNNDAITEASSFRKGEFFHVRRFDKYLRRGNVFGAVRNDDDMGRHSRRQQQRTDAQKHASPTHADSKTGSGSDIGGVETTSETGGEREPAA